MENKLPSNLFYLKGASEEGGAVALGMANVGGIFLLLSIGSFFAIGMNFAEFIISVHQQAVDNKVGWINLVFCGCIQTPIHKTLDNYVVVKVFFPIIKFILLNVILTQHVYVPMQFSLFYSFIAQTEVPA